MKPQRIAMTHHLVLGYGLHKRMEVFRPRRAYPCELTQFHADDYVDFLAKVTPGNQDRYASQLKQFNINEDCPIFEGLFDFCSLYAGASIEGALLPACCRLV